MSSFPRFSETLVAVVLVFVARTTLQAEDFIAQEADTKWQLITGTQEYLSESATTWIGRGYRLSNIEMFSDSGNLRYLAIFVPNPTNLDFKGEWGHDSATFWKKHREYVDAGLMLIDIEMALIDGEWKFAGVWLKNTDSLQWRLEFTQTSDELTATTKKLFGEGYSPVDIEITTRGNQTEMTTLWFKGLNRTSKIVWNRTPEQFSDEMHQLRKEGYRPIDIENRSVGDMIYWAAIYITGNSDEKWTASWGLKWDKFQTENADNIKAGMRPIAFSECQRSDCSCYGCVWFSPSNSKSPEMVARVPQPDAQQQSDRPFTRRSDDPKTKSPASGNFLAETTRDVEAEDSGDQMVLIPSGTRIWCFKQRGTMCSVNLPFTTRMVWIPESAISRVKDRKSDLDAIEKANAFAAKGEKLLAEDQLQEALENYESYLRVATPIVGACLPVAAVFNRAGICQVRLKKNAEAVKSFLYASSISEVFLGPNSPERIDQLNNLGTALSGVGKFDDAIQCVEKAMEASIRVNGKDSSHAQQIRASLANIRRLRDRGR